MTLAAGDKMPGHIRGTLAEVQEALRQNGWAQASRLRIPAPEDVPDGIFGTDKYEQGYIPVYQQLASELGSAARVCEIGVWHGGSLAVWKTAFPNGVVAGVDHDPAAVWPRATHRIVCGQDDPALPGKLAEISPLWDLIVDDASHAGDLTARTFSNLWPMVRGGGYYVIEDWFVGWRPGYQDTYNLRDLARDLLDLLRDGHDVDEIRYRFGMIIIRKTPPQQDLGDIYEKLGRIRIEDSLRLGRPAPPDTGVL